MEQGTGPEKRSSILGSSRERPAPLRAPVRTTIEQGDRKPTPETFTLTITLLEVMRGEEALARIRAEGVCDGPPKAGFEYVLSRIAFGYARKARGPFAPLPYTLREGAFRAASADGTEYEVPSVARQPEPALIGAPFSEGESREGWIVLQVPQGEKEPLLVFHREHDASAYEIKAPVWFRLSQFDPMCIDGACPDCR